MISIAICTATYSHAQVPADVGLEFVASVSDNLGVTHAGDGSNRLFVINQDGYIRVIDDEDNLLTTPFLDIDAKVNSGGNEQGLLGLAFHPEYSSNGYFYVNYSKSGSDSGDTIIERYHVTGDPTTNNVADAGSGTVIMRVVQDFSNHNGGHISFGPDGYFYIGMGDGGSGGDPRNRGQNLGSVLGTIMRIDVDGDSAPSHPAPVSDTDHVCPQEGDNYSIPADNPFTGTPSTCPEIWAWGVRNPWRFSFDKDTGDLYIGDVGQNAREEISFQAAASTGGENYGWNCREGDISFAGCTGTFVDPILVKNHSGGRCSITGGYVYRGPVESIQGQYMYGDYCSGQIWFASTVDNVNWTEDEWASTGGVSFNFSLTSFGEDEAGHVYIAHQGGNLYRITGDVADSDVIFATGFE